LHADDTTRSDVLSTINTRHALARSRSFVVSMST